MRLNFNSILTILLGLFLQFYGFAQENEDFFIGLVDDNKGTPIKHLKRIKTALGKGTQLHYRYRYLNGGVDTSKNWYSWDYIWDGSWPRGGQMVTYFAKEAEDIGMRPSWVIYALQEEGGTAGLLKNANDLNFMKMFFWNLEFAAKKSKGKKAIFVIEPDTWGYLLQSKLKDSSINENAPAKVNNVPGFPYLSDLPNNIKGVVQAIIKIFRVNAPDARVGMHANHWSVFPPGMNCGAKMVDFPEECLEKSTDLISEFYNSLFDGTDKGDFMIVEKYGLDAYAPGAAGGPDAWYWNDEQNANWVKWCKLLGDKMELPLMGWQIPIGNSNLKNTANSYKDSFMEYFFNNVKDFIDAGFKGLLVGKGLPQGTDYANDPGLGDDGWLFENLRKFDDGRPYLDPVSTEDRVENGNEFYISPNPVLNGEAGVFYNLNKPSTIKLRITDVSGRELISIDKTVANKMGNFNVDLNNFSKGLFFVTILNDQQRKVFKIINK